MNSSCIDLKVDWCSYKAAKYAVENWHYSGTMPTGKTVKIGCWVESKFIGCIIFSRGSSFNIGKPFNLSQTQIVELTRVALYQHKVYTTQIIKAAILLIKQNSPNLRLIISYADMEHNHIGIIYQAGNWIYTGIVHVDKWILFGRHRHSRSILAQYGTCSIKWLKSHVDPDARRIPAKGKYRYCYPLDKAMRRQIEKLRQPYPKRTPDGGASAPTEVGGSIPTCPLQ